MSKKVFLLGLGLIGGSLALSIKKMHQEIHIVGFDVNKEQCRLAKKLQVIDTACERIEDGAKDADLIIIATPVNITSSIMKTLANSSLKERVIITDVGSTKQQIVKDSKVLREKGITFIGGHPMAGSHKSGVIAAKERLFENAFYILTPTVDTPDEKVVQLKKWLAGTKAKFLQLTPKEHDYITGVISHFPHVIAASLVHQAKKANNGKNLVNRLAAGGFRDITRIASSNPEMWRDILLHNKEIIIHLLGEWKEEMGKVEALLLQEDASGIYDYFVQAKEMRDALPIHKKGAIHSFYDLFVDVPDYSGVISEITGYLAIEAISITNIRILETREDIYGVLVISFQSNDDRERAVECIHHYTNYKTSFGP